MGKSTSQPQLPNAGSVLDTTYIRLARDWSLWECPLKQALQRVTETLCLALDVGRASVWALNSRHDGIVMLMLHNGSDGENSCGMELLFEEYPVFFESLNADRVIDAIDAHRDHRSREFSRDYLTPLGIGAMINATLRTAGRLSGVLCIEHIGGQRVWSKDEKRFVISVADLLSQRLVYEDVRRNEVYYRELSSLQQAIFDGANYSIISTDIDGTIRSYNRAAARMLGYSEDELVGRHTPELFHVRDEITAFAAELSQQLGTEISPGFDAIVTRVRQGIAEEREWTFIRKDGSRLPVLLSVSALKNGNGEINGFLGIAFDITDRVLTRRALREEEERYRLLFEGAGDSIFLMKSDRFIDCNPATLNMFGCTREQILNETPYRYSPEYQTDGRLSAEKALEKIDAAFRGEAQQFEWRHIRHDGTPFDAEVVLNAISINGVQHLQATVRDISKRKQAERDIEQSRRELLNRNENLMLINNLSSRLHASFSLDTIYTETLFALLELSETPGVAIYETGDDPSVVNLVATYGFDESALRKGETLPLDNSLTGVALERGEIIVTTSIADDNRVNERIKAALLKSDFRTGVVIPLIYQENRLGSINLVYSTNRELSDVEVDTFRALGSAVSLAISNTRNMNELVSQAHHDALTGLSNRTLLHSTFEERVAGYKDYTAALLLLDLDRFKEINDTLGHYIGDRLLQQVGPRILSMIEDGTGLVCRLGGDEFTVLLDNVTDEGDVHAFGMSLRDNLRRPFYIDSMKLEIDVSIGIAIYPLDGDDSHALLRSADVAMYEAKRSGLGVMRYDHSCDKHTPERLALTAELGTAIRENQLCLHYQPKIDLQSGRIDGFESLVRWQHPVMGLLPPDKFIPLAEVSDAIHYLTRSVLELALAQQRAWRQAGHNYSVAVNLSARNLIDSRCVDFVEELLGKYGSEPGMLELEITETTLMFDPRGAAELLVRLSRLGVKLSIDDFGTGYSSLAYLRRMPIDSLKIDREFVSHMLHNEQDSIIVRSTIALAHNLNLKVIAEGVEDAATLNALREMGCDFAQGYHISRPDDWPSMQNRLAEIAGLIKD